jgi:hypothetical protein
MMMARLIAEEQHHEYMATMLMRRDASRSADKALRAFERQLSRLEWVAAFSFHSDTSGGGTSGGTMVIISSAPINAEMRNELDRAVAEYRSHAKLDISYRILSTGEWVSEWNP